MSVKETLNAARKRSEHREDMFNAMMQDLSDLEGARYELSKIRVKNTSDTQQRILELKEQYDNHAEAHISAIKQCRDDREAAAMLINSLDNSGWQKVLTLYYIRQLPWSVVAKEIGTTDDAARMMAARAIDNLKARQEKV